MFYFFSLKNLFIKFILFFYLFYFNHAANLLKYFDKLLKKINKWL